LVEWLHYTLQNVFLVVLSLGLHALLTEMELGDPVKGYSPPYHYGCRVMSSLDFWNLLSSLTGAVGIHSVILAVEFFFYGEYFFIREEDSMRPTICVTLQQLLRSMHPN